MSLTKLAPDVVTGCQVPRLLTRPDFYSEEAGQEALDLAQSVGIDADPWEQLLVKAILAEKRGGIYAAVEAAYLVARQNGKGVVLEIIALYAMFIVGDPLTLWTAHQTKTSFEAFQRLKGWIEGSDDLTRKVKAINHAHGDEGVTLMNGVRLRFLARSKKSGRGFSPQRIIFDEAQELPILAIDAMLPSMGAQSNWQAIYCGTVPGPENNDPEHWTRLRDRGRAGDSDRLMWAEWTPEGSDDPVTAAAIDRADLDVIRAANPGLGYRKRLETILYLRDTMDPESFAREELSIWPTTVGGEGVFGSAAWASCRQPEQPPPAALVLGVAVSVDRAWASIGAASLDDRDRIVLAAVERRRGVDWLPGEVARIQGERRCTVVIDGKGPSSTLVTPLENAGVDLTVLDTGQVCDAYADLYDRVRVARAVHYGHPDLDAAHAASVQRPVADRWAAGRRQSRDDVSMLEAVTLAAWGVEREAPPAIY